MIHKLFPGHLRISHCGTIAPKGPTFGRSKLRVIGWQRLRLSSDPDVEAESQELKEISHTTVTFEVKLHPASITQVGDPSFLTLVSTLFTYY